MLPFARQTSSEQVARAAPPYYCPSKRDIVSIRSVKLFRTNDRPRRPARSISSRDLTTVLYERRISRGTSLRSLVSESERLSGDPNLALSRERMTSGRTKYLEIYYARDIECRSHSDVRVSMGFHHEVAKRAHARDRSRRGSADGKCGRCLIRAIVINCVYASAVLCNECNERIWEGEETARASAEEPWGE